jgi:hypothetical protein
VGVGRTMHSLRRLRGVATLFHTALHGSHHIRCARTVAPVSKHVGTSRRLKATPGALSYKEMDGAKGPPPNFSIDIVEPELSPLETSSGSPVPESLPAPESEMCWQPLTELKSFVMVPPQWSLWSGHGEMFGMRLIKVIASSEVQQPKVETPHAVGLSITRYNGAFSQSVVKSDPKSLAEFMISMHIRRAAPAGGASDGFGERKGAGCSTAGSAQQNRAVEEAKQWTAATEALVNKIHPEEGEDGLFSESGEAAQGAPHMLDSWQHEVTPGVTLWGVEYTIAHSDLMDRIRGQAGMHYYVALVLNTLEDCVYEVEFRSPVSEWQTWWGTYGQHMTSNAFLNWTHDAVKFE